jgi:hypothetical protein
MVAKPARPGTSGGNGGGLGGVGGACGDGGGSSQPGRAMPALRHVAGHSSNIGLSIATGGLKGYGQPTAKLTAATSATVLRHATAIPPTIGAMIGIPVEQSMRKLMQGAIEANAPPRSVQRTGGLEGGCGGVVGGAGGAHGDGMCEGKGGPTGGIDGGGDGSYTPLMLTEPIAPSKPLTTT